MVLLQKLLRLAQERCVLVCHRRVACCVLLRCVLVCHRLVACCVLLRCVLICHRRVACRALLRCVLICHRRVARLARLRCELICHRRVNRRALPRWLQHAQLRGLVIAGQRLAARTHVRSTDLACRAGDAQHLMTHPALFGRRENEHAAPVLERCARHLPSIQVALWTHGLVVECGDSDGIALCGASLCRHLIALSSALHVDAQTHVCVPQLFLEQLLQVCKFRCGLGPCLELLYGKQRLRGLDTALYADFCRCAPVVLSDVVHLLPAHVPNAELYLVRAHAFFESFGGMLQLHVGRCCW